VDCPNWFNEKYMKENEIYEEIKEVSSMKTFSSVTTQISPKKMKLRQDLLQH
jgi:hypothetical protein